MSEATERMQKRASEIMAKIGLLDTKNELGMTAIVGPDSVTINLSRKGSTYSAIWHQSLSVDVFVEQSYQGAVLL